MSPIAQVHDTTLSTITIGFEELTHDDSVTIVISSTIRAVASILEEPERFFESSAYNQLARALRSQR